MPDPVVTTANYWRWKYPRPADVHSPGTAAAALVRGAAIDARKERGKREQHRLKRETGFPGGAAELGHAIADSMRRRGYGRSTAQLAAHLGAVHGPWNFQGNRRLAYWIGCSERTVRRHRARLEQDGWIASCLLLPGDMVLGQRAPVLRPQVVRDASKLQRLAAVRVSLRAPHQKRPKPTPARQPTAAEVPNEASIAELDELARQHAGSEFGAYFVGLAAARRHREASQQAAQRAAPGPSGIPDAGRGDGRGDRALGARDGTSPAVADRDPRGPP